MLLFPKDFAVTVQCKDCLVNTYFSATNNTCLACPEHTSSAAGSFDVSDCVCNTLFEGPAGGPCTRCDKGKFKERGTGQCESPSPSVNLARACVGGCATNQSSGVGNGASARAVDGYPSSLADQVYSTSLAADGFAQFDGGPTCIETAAGPGLHWWKLDMEVERDVWLVKIWSRDASAELQGFELRVGNTDDPEGNPVCYTGDVVSAQPPFVEYAHCGARGRFLFMTLQDKQLRACEVEVYQWFDASHVAPALHARYRATDWDTIAQMLPDSSGNRRDAAVVMGDVSFSQGQGSTCSCPPPAVLLEAGEVPAAFKSRVEMAQDITLQEDYLLVDDDRTVRWDISIAEDADFVIRTTLRFVNLGSRFATFTFWNTEASDSNVERDSIRYKVGFDGSGNRLYTEIGSQKVYGQNRVAVGIVAGEWMSFNISRTAGKLSMFFAGTEVISDLRFSGSTFDKIGVYSDMSTVHIRSLSYEPECHCSDWGLYADAPFLSGEVSSGIQFPKQSIPPEFTICSVTRYTDPLSQGRILDAVDGDWLHGHANGKRGSANYGTSVVKQNRGAATDWMVLCGQNSPGPDHFIMNGYAVAAQPAGSGIGGLQLSINSGINAARSSWAVMEILVWDRHLDSQSMLAVSDYLHCSLRNLGSCACPSNMVLPPGGSGVQDCICAAGYTGPAGGPCSACMPGTFKARPGSAECAACSGNTYSAVAGARACEQCAENAVVFTNGTEPPVCACQPGWTGPTWGPCTACESGSYKTEPGSAGCSECALGSFTDDSTRACIPCQEPKVKAVLVRQMQNEAFSVATLEIYTRDDPATDLARSLQCYAYPTGGAWYRGDEQGRDSNVNDGDHTTFSHSSTSVAGDNFVFCVLPEPHVLSRLRLVPRGTQIQRSTFFRVELYAALGVETRPLHGTIRPEGLFWSHDVLHSTNEGWWSEDIAVTAKCAPCAANTFFSVADVGCAACPADSSAAIGSTAASNCVCNAGFEGPAGGPCSPCAIGDFKADAGAEACAACPTGAYSYAPGASSCLPVVRPSASCPNNTLLFSPGVSPDVCICAPGFSGPDGGPCSACEAGTYKAEPGSTACAACPWGSYSSDSRAFACEAAYCASGTYQGSVASSSCMACPDHSDSPARSQKVGSCVCNAGFFGPDGGACSACPAHSHSVRGSAEAATTCRCNAGFARTDDGACTLCDAGTYSVMREALAVETCAPCPRNSWSEPGSWECACVVGFTRSVHGECVACSASGVCNAALFGPTLASSYQTLVVGAPAAAFSGLEFEVRVTKQDFYNQTVQSDSASILRVYSRTEASPLPDLAVDIVGSTLVGLQRGETTFRVALHPTFTAWNASAGTTALLRAPLIQFEGVDAEVEGLMLSDPILVDIHAGAAACPVGSVLELTATALGSRGSCRFCEPGSYSLHPLFSYTPSPAAERIRPMSASASTVGTPACLTCPAGATCAGGALVVFDEGTWVAKNGMYVLESCAAGHHVVNSVAGVFNHDVQRCEPCEAGTECSNEACSVCTPCKPGFYKAYQSADLCDPCPLNTYRTEPGAAELVACLQCPAAASTRGLVGQQGSAACLCDSGYYPEIGVDAPKCQPCPIGAAECNGTGLVAAEGSQWVTEGSHFRLVGCPAGSILVRNDAFAVADECVLCPFGKYSIVPPMFPDILTVQSASVASEECLLCDKGLQCDGGSDIKARRGYWLANAFQTQGRRSSSHTFPESVNSSAASERRAAMSEQQTKAILIPCPPNACQDGGQCSAGHEGPVCGICQHGWVKSGHRCRNCGSSDDVRTQRIVVGVVGGLLILAIFTRLALQPAIYGDTLDEAHCLSSCCSNHLGERILEWFRLHYWDIRDHVKVVVSFFQVVSTFHTSTSSQWGSTASLFDSAAIFRLGLSNLPFISCVNIGATYQDMLLLYTITPVLVCALLASPLPVLRLVNSPNLSYCLDQYWKVFGAFLFLVYPTVSIMSISAFNCQHVTDDLHLLIADYREPCPNDNPSGFIFSYSVFCVLLFPLGIILAAFGVMWHFKVPQLAQRKVDEARIHAMILLYIKQSADLDRNLLPMTPMSSVVPPSPHAARAGRRTSMARLRSIDNELERDGSMSHTGRGVRDSKIVPGVPETDVQFDDGYCFFEGNEDEQNLSEQQIISLLTHDWRHTPASAETTDLEMWTAKVTISGMEAWTGHQLRECSRAKLLSLLRESAMLLTAGGVLAVPAVKWDPGSLDVAESTAANRLGFLMMSYKPQYWYMELIELLRKFFTACATVFIWRRSVRQMAIVLAVTSFALLATMRLQPYRSRSVLNTQIFSLFVQCTTLLYGVLITAIEATEDTPPEESFSSGYPVILALFCLVPVFPLLLAVLRRIRNEWVRRTLALPADDGSNSFTQPCTPISPGDIMPGSGSGSIPPSESVGLSRPPTGAFPRTHSHDSVFSRRSTGTIQPAPQAPSAQDLDGKSLSPPGIMMVGEARALGSTLEPRTSGTSGADSPTARGGSSTDTSCNSLSAPTRAARASFNPVTSPSMPDAGATSSLAEWARGESADKDAAMRTCGSADGSERSDSERAQEARGAGDAHHASPSDPGAGSGFGSSDGEGRKWTRAPASLGSAGMEMSRAVRDSQARVAAPRLSDAGEECDIEFVA